MTPDTSHLQENSVSDSDVKLVENSFGLGTKLVVFFSSLCLECLT